jgi:hypothetical protein
MATDWRDALLALHDNGWDADDIDSACEALIEACDEGAYAGLELSALSLLDAVKILDVELDDDEVLSLLEIAEVRSQQDSAAARALHNALYDLDAFAYEMED